LLVAFDLPAPEPLHAKCAMAHPVAAAAVLTRQPTAHSMAALTCNSTSAAESTLDEAALEQLRLGNPAARALPLMQMLALQHFGPVVLPLGPAANLAVELHAP
jgi:hypothetical protein